MATRIKGLDAGSTGSISSSSNPIEQVRRPNAVGTQSSNSSNSQSSGSSGESVTITDSARQLASLSQAVQDTPDVDTSRVTKIQQAIESGTYQIDPERIADGLIQMDYNLGNAGQ